jgi:hypothetical protein
MEANRSYQEMTVDRVIIVTHYAKGPTTEKMLTLEEAVRYNTKKWVIQELYYLIEYVETM